MARLSGTMRLLGIGALAALAAACSAARTSPTQTEAPTVTGAADIEPTLTLPPTASPTPRPSPSLTPTPLPSVEIVTSRTWTNFEGHLVIEVLLQNTDDTAVYLDGVFGVLLDAAGEHVLGTQGHLFDGSVMGGLGRMLPGELVPATISFVEMSDSNPVEWDHYEIRLLGVQEYPISPDEYSADFETSVSTIGRYSYGILDLNGIVVNHGSQPAEFVFLRAILYDEDGEFLGAAEGIVYSLAPGASATFSIGGIVDPEAEIGRYEITALARVGTP